MSETKDKQVVDGDSASSPIGAAIIEFAEHVSALRSMIATTMFFAHANAQTAVDKIKEFAHEHGTNVVEQDGHIRFEVARPYSSKSNRLMSEADRAWLGCSLIPRSFLVAVVSEYDAYLGILVRRLLLNRPDLLSVSDRQFSFAELSKFSSLQDVTDRVIDKDVESLLRQSHPDQFDQLEKSSASR